MKKAIFGSLILAGLVFIGFTAVTIYDAFKSDKVTFYHRFTKVDETGNTKFNWSALVFGLAEEAQNKVTETVTFDSTIVYPLAPQFKCVAPSNMDAERHIAGVIARKIADTVNAIRMHMQYDFDKNSIAVRRAAEPSTLSLSQPEVTLSMKGTASPESAKDGFEQSIEPGHIEPENMALAKERLNRTDSLLLQNLRNYNIKNVRVLDAKYEEMQLTKDQVPKVLADHSLLDSMRYVKAHVRIVMERLDVTPFTLPFLPFIWLAGLLALGSSLWGLLKRKKVRPVHEKAEPKKRINWEWVRTFSVIANIILISVAIACFLHLFPKEIFDMLFWIIIGVYIIIIGFMMYEIFSNSSIKRELIYSIIELGKALLWFTRWIILLIPHLLRWIYLMIVAAIRKFIDWWTLRCDCCKILMIILFLHLLFDLWYFVLR